MRSASEEPVPLHEEFIYCCGAATHVLKCGPWKDLSKDESKNLPRLLFMIIPEGGLFSAGPILLQPLKPTEKFPLGILDPMQSSLQPLCQHRLYQTRDTNYIWDVKSNPGLAGYYRTFIQALYCGLNQQYPVWVVSHAGHCKPPSGMEMIEDTDIKELEDVFGLNGQVEHKLNFLKKNVSKDIKLVLIAHSIGCYITLEMMKRASELQILSMPMKTLPEGPVIKSLDPICSQAMKTQIPLSKVEVTDIAMMLSVALKKFAFPREQEFLQPIKENVLRSVLLFPTIERMAQSPQGKLMTPLLCKLRYVLYMPVYLLSFLPEGVKASLVRFALRGMKTCDESSITTSVNLFSVDCIANILYMASQEMMKVVERDSTTIKQNLKKLIFYYGTGDSWCPQQYYDEIKMDFPDGDIRLCEKGLRHAFVLDASKEMAAMITDWLQDDLTKL